MILRKNALALIVIELAVVFSVFSQIDVVERVTRPIMYFMWILALGYGCFRKHGKLALSRFSKRFIVGYLFFCIFCVLIGFFDGRHMAANYIRVLIVPLLVSITGDLYSDENQEFINRTGKVYLLCSIIYAFWVQRTYFPSYAIWLKSRQYIFQSKNSAGQIWVSAIFIALIVLNYKNKFEKGLIYCACLYLFIMTGISQCRTALLGVAVAVVSFAISRAKKKVRWVLLVTVFVILVWIIPATHNFIVQALFLNKYAGADLNTFSSGRIVRYSTAFKNIISSPIIGVGKYYVDSSYILILAESGLIGFVIVEWIWFYKIFLCFKYNGDDAYKIFLYIITVFYVIESILEGFPPFGPGVSSFMFWFLSGILINKKKKHID